MFGSIFLLGRLSRAQSSSINTPTVSPWRNLNASEAKPHVGASLLQDFNFDYHSTTKSFNGTTSDRISSFTNLVHYDVQQRRDLHAEKSSVCSALGQWAPRSGVTAGLGCNREQMGLPTARPPAPAVHPSSTRSWLARPAAGLHNQMCGPNLSSVCFLLRKWPELFFFITPEQISHPKSKLSC